MHDDRPLVSQELAGTSANIYIAPSRPARAGAFTVASLYCLMITRMKTKVKNINGYQLLPFLFILLALISEVKTQVRFSALPGSTVPQRVQEALKQQHDSPNNQKLWSKKAMISCDTSWQKARGML